MSEEIKACKYCGSRAGGCLYCIADPSVVHTPKYLNKPVVYGTAMEHARYLAEGIVLGENEAWARELAEHGLLRGRLLKNLLTYLKIRRQAGRVSDELFLHIHAELRRLLKEQKCRGQDCPVRARCAEIR